MASAKDCHALTSYYEKRYKEEYNMVPNVNRVTARWNFDSILSGSGVTVTTVKEMIDYYFTTPKTRSHSLDWFFYNYDKLVDGMKDSQADAEHRNKLMEESRIRTERWLESGGKPRITND